MVLKKVIINGDSFPPTHTQWVAVMHRLILLLTTEEEEEENCDVTSFRFTVSRHFTFLEAIQA